MSAQASLAAGVEGLRERSFAHAVREEESSGGSSGLDTPHEGDEIGKQKKTFGRTPSGTSKSTCWMDQDFMILDLLETKCSL
jgi:phosphatidylethanolamine N-methyltransferase